MTVEPGAGAGAGSGISAAHQRRSEAWLWSADPCYTLKHERNWALRRSATVRHWMVRAERRAVGGLVLNKVLKDKCTNRPA